MSLVRVVITDWNGINDLLPIDSLLPLTPKGIIFEINDAGQSAGDFLLCWTSGALPEFPAVIDGRTVKLKVTSVDVGGYMRDAKAKVFAQIRM